MDSLNTPLNVVVKTELFGSRDCVVKTCLQRIAGITIFWLKCILRFYRRIKSINFIYALWLIPNA